MVTLLILPAAISLIRLTLNPSLRLVLIMEPDVQFGGFAPMSLTWSVFVSLYCDRGALL